IAMGLTPADIGALLEQFEASSWQEMTIDIGEDHLHVSRRANGSSAAPAAVETSGPAAPAPSPVAANGEAAVETVDTLSIIEVMKLMSPLKAGLSGVVTAILVANGATVARGEPLVLIDPER